MRQNTKEKLLKIKADIENGAKIENACKRHKASVGTWYQYREQILETPQKRAYTPRKPYLETIPVESSSPQMYIVFGTPSELAQFVGALK